MFPVLSQHAPAIKTKAWVIFVVFALRTSVKNRSLSVIFHNSFFRA